MCIYIYIYICIHIHTYIHTYINTYIHTYIYHTFQSQGSRGVPLFLPSRGLPPRSRGDVGRVDWAAASRARQVSTVEIVLYETSNPMKSYTSVFRAYDMTLD